MDTYPIVPGRGLLSQTATDLRLDYLKNQGHEVEFVAANTISPEQIRNNIESFIGAVEIPLGLAGPLLFKNDNKAEAVHALVGTLEGALVASMNRGAKAISLSGGFDAAVLHQKMIRAPMFIFESLQQALVFKNWVEKHFPDIQYIAEQYSNHARLTEILPYIIGKSVHLKFVYTTGDASGQNMTTSCTWHATLFLQDKFEQETGIKIAQIVIEGNGAGDKKVSHFSMNHGRGVHVVAECNLDENVIQKVLRTTSQDIANCFNQSVAMSRLDGMMGYNINVANAIAAIFVATGQDLACIHESGCGILNVEKTGKGLYLSLNLPSLVIGTVGGGTHLSKQKEALQIMGCYGSGKLNRFAQLIAGFALSLEISTYAAIVSGQFAKAHEKLGRNKPVNWLLKSDINKNFMSKCLDGKYIDCEVLQVRFPEGRLVENGIITGLTNRVSKKLIGFLPVEIIFLGKQNQPQNTTARSEILLLKSKPLDTEVIKGLHFMAAAINTELADLLVTYKDALEYKNCHTKEIILYKALAKNAYPFMPQFSGSHIDAEREIYVLAKELLDYTKLCVHNSENEPDKWQHKYIKSAISAITKAHIYLREKMLSAEFEDVQVFEPWKAKPLYRKLVNVVAQEYEELHWEGKIELLYQFVDELEEENKLLQISKTIVHNDFNPRNMAIRENGEPCIYDWELAVQNFPHRDIAEFLSFVLPDHFTETQLLGYLHFHHDLHISNGEKIPWIKWKKGYEYALKEYLVTRITFYLAGSIVMKYEFAERICKNAFRMLEMLQNQHE